MGTQTTTIEIDQLTAIILRAKAEAEGLTITDWLRSMAEAETFRAQSTFFETASPEERAKAVEEWANQTRSTAPPLPDCAINRDAIYAERENKQL